MNAARPWTSIVVGMDASPEAAEAAVFGLRLAEAVGAPCCFAHAVPEPWSAIVDVTPPRDLLEFRQALVHSARQDLVLHLRERDAPGQADDVIVRLGRTARVLQQVVDERNADLVVLGGKRHSALARWLGGSTAHNAVRSLSVPVLVTRTPPAAPRRILVAVDMSAAANPTLATAERLALAFGAQLRAVSVLEPFPVSLEGSPALTPEYFALWEEMLKRDVWPLLRHPATETVVRQGPIIDTLAREAADWHADLLVVGSHGKGWVDRMLIGSVTERLLNDLPTSLLVVPVTAAVESSTSPEDRRAPAANAAHGVLALA